MFTTEDNQDSVLRACQQVVVGLARERGWHLLEPSEWADQIFAEVWAEPAVDPRPAAVRVYSRALYVACSGAEGEQRREQGYAELFSYLRASARQRFPLVYDDAAQQAIEFVVDRFERCRAPGTFLSFALYQLLAAARSVTQQLDLSHRHAGSPALEDRAVAESARDRQPDLSAPLITAELRSRFEHLAAEFLRKHPRAWMQLAALRLKYIDGLDDAVIGAQLSKPLSSVYVLRSRAVEKLRAEPEWRALAVEFGILLE